MVLQRTGTKYLYFVTSYLSLLKKKESEQERERQNPREAKFFRICDGETFALCARLYGKWHSNLMLLKLKMQENVRF